MGTNDKILSAIEEATVLGWFKSFCEKNNTTVAKQRLRNILSRAQDKPNAIRALFLNEMKVELNEEQAQRMYYLVEAFLKKSTYRRPVSADIKQQLLVEQKQSCKMCGKSIDLSAHADHIVPFKYVGDELDNNFQMLCSHCNEAKNASIDYEIRFMLHIV